jgi:cysteine-rich repeat protein
MTSRPCILALALLHLACPGQVATTTEQGPDSSSSGDASSGTAGTIGDSTTGTTGAPTTTANLGDTLDSTSTTTTTETTATTGTTADDTTTTTTTSTTGTTGDALCGNGLLDPGEACDDGNGDDADQCLSSCLLGPGDQGEVLPLPPLPQQHQWRCFTAIDEALLPGSEHALVLGSTGWQGQDYVARLDRLNLADGSPDWTWTGNATPNGLEPRHAVAAANGDILVAGLVWTEIVKPDTGGYLWVARFTSDGAPIWDHRLDTIAISPTDLELAPSGDFVLVGNSIALTGGVTTAQVHRFAGDGALLWSFAEDSDEYPQITRYVGVTATADTTYVAGYRYHATDDLPTDHRVHVRAFAAGGAPVWELERPPDRPVEVSVGDIDVSGDRLFVSLASAPMEELPRPGAAGLHLLALDLDGDELWWKDRSLPAPWRGASGLLVPAPGGGVFVVGNAIFDEAPAHHLARFDLDGEPLWSKLAPGAWIRDVLFAPDDRLHVLDEGGITRHDP